MGKVERKKNQVKIFVGNQCQILQNSFIFVLCSFIMSFRGHFPNAMKFCIPMLASFCFFCVKFYLLKLKNYEMVGKLSQQKISSWLFIHLSYLMIIFYCSVFLNFSMLLGPLGTQYLVGVEFRNFLTLFKQTDNCFGCILFI